MRKEAVVKLLRKESQKSGQFVIVTLMICIADQIKQRGVSFNLLQAFKAYYNRT